MEPSNSTALAPATTSVPAWAQSSVDQTQVSLTITSVSKAVAGLLITYATIKGIDPAIFTTNVQNITEAAQNGVAQYVAVLPALYSAYQSIKVIEGVMRKIAVRLFKKAPTAVLAPTATVVVTPATPGIAITNSSNTI